MTTPTAAVLSATGVSKRFGAVQALNGVSIELHRGEVTALLGDNGAGKSTLVKILSGVERPDGGTFAVDGSRVELNTASRAQSLGIATVYQDLALCDNLDVVANLFLGRAYGRLVLDEESMEKEAMRLLATLSVTLPSVRAKIAGMSGGQRQSVAIARSLVGEPSVVILDEPTAALGVSQTKQVLELIRRLRDSDYAVMVITHNMEDVAAVADRAVVLRLGRNNGVFRLDESSTEDLVGAITGATSQSNGGAAPIRREVVAGGAS